MNNIPSQQIITSLITLTFAFQFVLADKASLATQNKLIDRCCQVGKERAIESSKFTCKLSAREALIPSGSPGHNPIAASAEFMLAQDANFSDQCEMVLESCCLAHHRSRNCDSGKQFAKLGSSCMDVELSKEATIATESFNDCCMSCSLGILAAKNTGQNDTSKPNNLADRCRLISPLASSLSGQLYEQTYTECCQENLPKLSSALLDSESQIDCVTYNPCSQRCVSGERSTSGQVSRSLEQDRCDCFAGYKLASDGISCLDIDECKLNLHTCSKQSEICDNTRGSFRCLARLSDDVEEAFSFVSQRLPLASSRCPSGTRWNANENRCRQPEMITGSQRSASLLASNLRSSPLLNSSGSLGRLIVRR